ncbi:MAG: TrkA family potassium uptake protein [Bacillota bacterium]|nr:TrkA family potassium uptake protein [Bacillota bacterium]
MQVIVIGCGRVGATLAHELVRLEHDVVVIDEDARLLESVADLDCVTIAGVPIDQEVLRRGGIETADAVCCCTPSENMNVMAAEIARSLFQVPRVLVRSYTPWNAATLRELNFHTVSGTEIVVERMLQELGARPDSVAYTLFGHAVRFQELAVAGCREAREALAVVRRGTAVLLGCVRAGVLLPPDDFDAAHVESGDRLILMHIAAGEL